MTKTDKEIRGWKEIIIETEDGELIVDITAEDYIAKDGYSIRLVPCEDEKPTIDVAEIVRCKDCIHRYVTGDVTKYYVCDFMDAQYEDNGYCHHGEREEE